MGKLKNLPKFDRPREKLFEKGPRALKDFELIAILLRTGYKGQSVLDLAKKILSSRNLVDLAIMNPKDIAKMKGVGSSRAATISASLEIAKRVFKNDSAIKIISPEDVIKVIGHIRNKKKEHFVALYLDARHQLIKTETISIGTVDASIVHPRDVFSPALKYNAVSVIIAHNHPSGEPEPSHEDTLVTKRIIEAGRIIGIELIDHIILSSSKHISFKEKGQI